MCGILGGLTTRFTAESLNRLHHRGPDQQRLFAIEVPQHGTLTLGQARLNIVDRNDVSLPVRIGQSVILFNGEIYNHPELRSELTQLGWRFQTRTDTEVVLAAYLHWGRDCLHKFNGMFALAIWDGERFFLARDRMGKKPLFYRCAAGSFEFASEIKAFDRLEFVGNDAFDLFEFCFDEHTLFRGILALPPGHELTYDVERGTCDVRSYWDIEHTVGQRIADERKAVDTFIDLLTDAVRLRLRADVPVTLFLAGGIDSSLIAKLSGVTEAFTCQFEEFRDTINEEGPVRDLAHRLGFQSHVVRPTRAQFFEDLPSIAYHLEMPTGSFSAFPLFELARAAHERNYKVTLSGEGSDELFAGYARNEFLVGDVLDLSSAKQRHYSAMLARYHGDELDRFCRMASRTGLAGASLLRAYFSSRWSAQRSFLDNLCYVETRVFLQPLLQMSDRMGMAHHVEVRCPFLDHRLVEFAFSLDDSLRFRNGTGKWIVRRAAEKLLPKDCDVLKRPVKDGLPTPVNLWLQGRSTFDRRHWNALLTAECVKSLLGSQPLACAPKSTPAEHVQPRRGNDRTPIAPMTTSPFP